jgi:hypothetical protein
MKGWSLKNIHPKLETILWITFAWPLISIMQFLIAYATFIELDYDFGDFDESVPLKTNSRSSSPRFSACPIIPAPSKMVNVR